MNKYTLIFMLSIFSTSEAGLANNTKAQIGNQFFSGKSTPTAQVPTGQNSTEQIGNSYFQGVNTKSISHVGPAFEEHHNYAQFFVFVNQLLTNHVYYELRAYATYHYITQAPPTAPLVTAIIPVSSERNLMGYGGAGILGYNININSNVSFMPFIRLQDLTNTLIAYSDSFGNEVTSVNYTAYLGGKLSMRVTDSFAIYTQYFAGYQKSVLSGRGLFSSTDHPTVKALVSIFEFGAPFKLNNALSITPFLQFFTAGINSNQTSRDKRYNISLLTNPSSIYGIKLGYEF